ncbi:DUF4198 domain-containing protein [uncultured Caulobacter sp.]|uniref:DUF4198 domain-containing protein n=1 Tax=uncultured Caulobacter sp. TaxID=158749 RepID=UPI002608E00C|nr:DUF4198 domain-containing protein [uncultured Caulobacter sp.]
MSLKARLLAVVALGATAILPAAAHAGRNWVAPSTTVLSGPNAWVTFDAASSDDLFFPDLRPLPITSITVLDADGQPVQPSSPSMGKFRSTFDVQVTKPGTWKVASVTTSIMASWTENGEVKRFRGSGEDFAKQVPAGAADLKTIRSVSRSETFVTRDKPTDAALKPTGQGLELQAVTHPSDVVATEPATFKLLIDGKPAAGLEVTLMRGYDRWSAKGEAETVVKTGPDGAFKITVPQAGLWWISASYRSGETGRGGPPPGGMPGMGGQPPAAQPLAGDGYSASYTAVIEAQTP